jgi:hypothetical protein
LNGREGVDLKVGDWFASIVRWLCGGMHDRHDVLAILAKETVPGECVTDVEVVVSVSASELRLEDLARGGR